MDHESSDQSSTEALSDEMGRLHLIRSLFAFDNAWFRDRYPDICRNVVESGGIDLEEFQNELGQSLGCSPNAWFDIGFFLSQVPEANSELASKKTQEIVEYFLTSDHAVGSPHWLFDETYYQKCLPDLEMAGLGRHPSSLYIHFLLHGDREWKTPHPFFDPQIYLSNLALVGETSRARIEPFHFFLTGGCTLSAKTATSWYFDPVWYLATYPEVGDEIQSGRWSSALEHYLRNDTPTKYNPVPEYDESFYLSSYIEVFNAVEAGEYRNGFDHFVRYGAHEQRQPFPGVFLDTYYSDIRVQSEVKRGTFPDVFAHFRARRFELAQSDAIGYSEAQTRHLAYEFARTTTTGVARRKLDFAISKKKPDVAIVMAIYNQFALTVNTLSSLRSCYRGDIELIIVDSGSTDESRALEHYVLGAKIFRHDRNIGYVEACNQALRHVSADVVIYMNNDITLEFGAIDMALRRLRDDPLVGAVGGKVIRTNGKLQEAGCIIWKDGSTAGYLRDEDPDAPEANFVRDVDFCSAVFLATPTALANQLAGFDSRFVPSYYEDTDFCVRLRQAGYRILYDPTIVVRHYEFGSSSSRTADQITGSHIELFRHIHREFLCNCYPNHPGLVAKARSTDHKRRVLFFEDRIPLRKLGSGFTRSNDVVNILAALGYHVTVFPIYKATESFHVIALEFSDNVEIIYDRGLDELAAFLKARPNYYDYIWISRTHNVDRLTGILQNNADIVPISRIVIDTEAVAAVRTFHQKSVLGMDISGDLLTETRKELSAAVLGQHILAVNELDREMIVRAGFQNVSVLGHVTRIRSTPRSFFERKDILFLGAIHDYKSPNLDAMVWFVQQVMPHLPDELGLTIAGFRDRRTDISALARERNVRLIGAVDDVFDLYNQHRVFVAPIRFAGGVSFKIHEAAGHGLPIVCTELLREQLGWRNDEDLLSIRTGDAAGFAEAILQLHNDVTLWTKLRDNALDRVRQENAEAHYAGRLDEILGKLGSVDRRR